MGKGLSSIALSPTMESPQHLDDVFQHVKGCKEKGKSWWWQCVHMVLVSLMGAFEVICQLHCKCCDTILSPSNPSSACKTHFESRNWSGYREGVRNGLIPVEEQPAAAEAGPSSSTMQPSSSNKRQTLGLSQQRLDNLKAGNQGEVHWALGPFIFNNSVPLHIIEDRR